jgi:hypothetical protein
MRFVIYTALLLLLNFGAPCFGQDLQWDKVASGIWVSKVGVPDSVNFLTTAGVKPKVTAINAMEEVSFPLSEEISYRLLDGKTYLHFPLEKNERIFGLGLNFKTVEQRGRITPSR